VVRFGFPTEQTLDINTLRFPSKASEKTRTSLPFSSLAAARVLKLRTGNTAYPAGSRNCKMMLGHESLALGVFWPEISCPSRHTLL
jgi:hypothetical protein